MRRVGCVRMTGQILENAAAKKLLRKYPDVAERMRDLERQIQAVRQR